MDAVRESHTGIYLYSNSQERLQACITDDTDTDVRMLEYQGKGKIWRRKDAF